MIGHTPVRTAACNKQVALQLTQLDKQADVALAGDILTRDCLVLQADTPFTPQQQANLFVRFLAQSFYVSGSVESSQADGQGHYMVVFHLNKDDNHLQTRMLLQLSKVEQYRHEMARAGRPLTMDEAACEWVTRYAEQFADEFDA